jgi:hypothetical protein
MIKCQKEILPKLTTFLKKQHRVFNFLSHCDKCQVNSSQIKHLLIKGMELSFEE